MKAKFFHVLFALVIMAVMVFSLAPTGTVSAAGSVSIHIVKYDTDRVTKLSETTVSIATMAATLPVQGDGSTHYFTQGPTFDPNNMWDPNKLCPGDSLKDKGALKGTALKDLCDLVGGMNSADSVSVKASDGYGDTFDYPNVYNTLSADLNARQGKMVICWSKDGAYSGNGTGTWSDGMLLAFFPTVTSNSTNPAANGKYIFGHQDMHDCLPQHDWHYYYDGGIQYPSTHGLYFKWVSEISIYKGGTTGWTVALSGASNFALTQEWFENGIACHTPSNNPLAFTYSNSSGNWSGLPLWYICGVVDDGNTHGPGAFNDNLYYDVKVSAKDGYSYTFSSTTIARNNNYLLANKLNGADLPEEKYPLKLVSPDFTAGGPSVAQIAKIELLNISSTPPVTPTPTPGTADWPLLLVGEHSYSMTKTTFESGVSCHVAATYTDEDNNVWSGLPLWLLVGYVDDANQHGAGAFNDELAATGYRIKVYAADGYYQIFNIADVARNNNVFLANKLNGADLPANTGVPGALHPAYPLKITGSATASGSRVGAVVKIELLDLPSLQPVWDLNGDHACNVGDMVIIGLRWGQTGTAGWIPADLNKDGVINIGDIVKLGLYWGQIW